MKTTVEALKGLYTAVGGTDDVKSISTVEDMLGKITEALGGEMPKGVLTTADAISKVAEVATGGGGGGSSDFSMATITMNSTIPDNTELYLIGERVRGTITALFVVDDILITEYQVFESGTETIKVMLYKGSAQIFLGEEYVSSSGNASWDSETMYLTVTGDCSVTATGTE